MTLGSAAVAQELPNGQVVHGAINGASQQDSYTFSANAGEGIQLRLVDPVSGPLILRMVVNDPSGAQIHANNGDLLSGIEFSAAVTGTYTVIVSQAIYNGIVRSGPYDLYFTRAPGANELGALTNAGVASGRLEVGDLDSYTFSANVGEGIRLSAVDVAKGDLRIYMVVYGPSGAVVDTGNGELLAAVDFSAPSTGTYTVVLTQFIYNGTGAAGDYDLYFTRAPGANELGALTNGGMASERLEAGDLDSYTFSAKVGDAIQMHRWR